MKRGPAPTPTVIRRLKNSDHRPIRTDEAAPLPLADFEPPEVLSEGAKVHWRKLAPELASLGLLTSIDTSALGLLCTSLDQWDQAQRGLQQFGLLTRSSSNNGASIPMISPFFSVSRHAQREVARLLSEFGLTPSSRSRVVTTLPKRDAQSERFFGPMLVAPLPKRRR